MSKRRSIPERAPLLVCCSCSEMRNTSANENGQVELSALPSQVALTCKKRRFALIIVGILSILAVVG